MKKRISFLAALLAFMSMNIGQAHAQSSPEVYKFNQTQYYKLQRSQGSFDFPISLRSVDQMTHVGYRKADIGWDINHGANTMVFKRERALDYIKSTNPKQSLSVEEAKSILISYYQWYKLSFYDQAGVAFPSEDPKCSTMAYKAYCQYPDSNIVMFPYLLNGREVFRENGTKEGLVMIFDAYTNDVMSISGLIENQTEGVPFLTEKLGDFQSNAYMIHHRIYDNNAYIIPVQKQGEVFFFPQELVPYGFVNDYSDIPPVVQNDQNPPAISGNDKIYSILGQSVAVAQVNGFMSGHVVGTTAVKSLLIIRDRVRIGRVMFFESNARYESTFLNRGGVKVYEKEGLMGIFLPSLDVLPDSYEGLADILR